MQKNKLNDFAVFLDGQIEKLNRLKGSGSKENVGRHKNPYVSKRIDKMVPESVYDKCLSLIDAEVLKFKLELSKTKNSKK